jgi:hypothetical protein
MMTDEDEPSVSAAAKAPAGKAGKKAKSQAKSAAAKGGKRKAGSTTGNGSSAAKKSKVCYTSRLCETRTMDAS